MKVSISMKNNKKKIDALIKKYFNVEYYNLKNRIESSLDGKIR